MKKTYELTIETTGRPGTEKVEAALIKAVEEAVLTLTFPLGGAEVKIVQFAVKPEAPAPAPPAAPAPPKA
jgi:hypothetical protein